MGEPLMKRGIGRRDSAVVLAGVTECCGGGGGSQPQTPRLSICLRLPSTRHAIGKALQGREKNIGTAAANKPAPLPSSADRKMLAPSEIRNITSTIMLATVDCLMV